MPETIHRARPGRRPGRALALLVAAGALFASGVALAPAASAAPPTAGEATIDAPADGTVGDPVVVSVALAGAVDVFAFDLAVAYDPALLAFDEAATTFPAGGFDAVDGEPGALEITHTRLGTSPGLSGDITLVTLHFTARASGSATVTLTAATLVSSTTETTLLEEPLVATTVIAAAPTQEPSPGPSPSGTTDPGPTPSATGAAASEGSLAVTGADAAVWGVAAAVAAALVALGVVFVLRRRAGATR